MICKYLPLLLLFLLFSPGWAPSSFAADDEDLQAMLDDRVSKMQKILHLTDTQVRAVRPIIKDYLFKCEAVAQEATGGGIFDRSAAQDTLNAFKSQEYEKLSLVLTPDQVKKWTDRENLMTTLNRGGTAGSVGDDSSFGMDGARMAF
jgi:hypothetical protein